VVQTATTGNHGYGTFTLDALGNWTYSADNSLTTIQHPGVAQSITDSFTAVHFDGSASRTVTVTIYGTNDAAVIDGVSIRAVRGDVCVVAAHLCRRAARSTSVPYPTLFRSVVQTATTGNHGYGTFTLDALGNWTYSA